LIVGDQHGDACGRGLPVHTACQPLRGSFAASAVSVDVTTAEYVR
jgi:hypothetical protein